MADAKTIAATIRELATGTVEWRVQDPVEKCYCISFDHRSSINPAREAREWLSDHKARHPNSMHAGYEVAEVRWFSRLERAALEAADALDPAGVMVYDAPMYRYVCPTCGAGGAHPKDAPAPTCHRCREEGRSVTMKRADGVTLPATPGREQDAVDAALSQMSNSIVPAGVALGDVEKPVARLHIRQEDDGLEADIEVLDGTRLQPEHSPVDVYLRPRGVMVDAPAQPRALTQFELLHARDNHPVGMTPEESAIRKFCEVNGLTYGGALGEMAEPGLSPEILALAKQLRPLAEEMGAPDVETWARRLVQSVHAAQQTGDAPGVALGVQAEPSEEFKEAVSCFRKAAWERDRPEMMRWQLRIMELVRAGAAGVPRLDGESKPFSSTDKA